MKHKKNSNWFDRLWKTLSSVKLAVVLLVLIAATAIIGTVIPQNNSPEFYVHNYGETWYSLFTALNIVDMYHSAWFIGLLLLLCLNIVVCSIERLSATWTLIFPKSIRVQPDRYRKKKDLETFHIVADIRTAISRCEAVCKKNMSRVKSEDTENGKAFYAEKGRWTRIGVYLIHASILFFLVGALIGAIYGFKGQMRLNEDQTDNMVALPKQQVMTKLPFMIRCNEFSVSFYDSGQPKEYRSNLTLIEDGEEVLTKDVLVNHPLRYKGINVFQSSYGTATPETVTFSLQDRESGMVFEKTVQQGQTQDLPQGKGTFVYEGFMSSFNFRGHNIGDVFVCTIEAIDAEPVQTIVPIEFPTFDKMRKGKFVFTVSDFEKRYYTGLQVTKDPGVWYVYSGFILIIAGCWITFLMSHQSVFVELTPEDNGTRVAIYGTANKNRQNMKSQLRKIINSLKG